MTDRFKRLMEGLCEGMDATDAKAIADSGSLAVDGMPMALHPGGETDPDGLAAYCDLGPLPAGQAGVRAATRLLELNLAMFRPGSYAFGLHAESGHVMTMVQFDIRQLTTQTLQQALVDLAAVGSAWQETHFVDGSMIPPAPDAESMDALTKVSK